MDEVARRVAFSRKRLENEPRESTGVSPDRVIVALADQVAALESANAELRAQAVQWEQQIQASAKAHERTVAELRADNNRLQQEVVRLGDERDAYKAKRDEWRKTADADNEKARKLNEQLAARDARIAGLEASAADLVRRRRKGDCAKRPPTRLRR